MTTILAWFVRNPVASNLLMLSLIFGGLITLPNLHREEFPNIDVDKISIVLPYPGASAEEIELSVCSRIEEAINSTPGIKKLTSIAAENRCQITVEVAKGENKTELLNKIKNKIDSIDTFPEEAEKPVISAVTLLSNVIQAFIYGDSDEHSLKRLAEKMRLELLDFPEVSQVFIHYARPYEISIEVAEKTLRRHSLTLQQVTNTIAANSIDLPAGSIETREGEILLRTINQARDRQSFEEIIILSRRDGSKLRLGDIATVNDDFVRSDVKAFFNGQPALMLSAKRIGNEDVIVVADRVKDYFEQARRSLPEGMHIALWADESQDLVDRIDTLGKNGIGGLILILIVLTLFLKPALAFWVATGLPITLLGSVMMFPSFEITISTISVVGALLVLGILVDAGVVVAERSYGYMEAGKPPQDAAIRGVGDVATPVIFGVLTSMVAFTPLITMDSDMSALFSGIGLTAIIALSFSLITSQLILPMHLSRMRHTDSDKRGTLQKRLSDSLNRIANHHYRPALQWCLQRRYLVISTAAALLIIVLAFLASGRIIFQFFPAVEGERLYANISMPMGTPAAHTERATQQLLDSAAALREEMEGSEAEIRISDSMRSIGMQLGRGSIGGAEESGGHQAEVALQLEIPANYRGEGAKILANRWRTLTGDIPGSEKLTFTADAFSPGKAIEIELRGRNIDDLAHGAAELRQALQGYPGVFDIVDSFDGGKQELQLGLREQARTLGLNASDIARQVRQAFYGEEVQRLPRGREDIRVMVRYPEEERRSLANIENMRIRTGRGDEVPFHVVAEANMGRSLSSITRIDGLRVISVSADVDRRVITPEEVLDDISQRVLPQLDEKYQLLSGLAGEAEDAQTAVTSLIVSAAIALFVIFTLLAIPLQSYLQPLIVMSVIPFGAIGAIIGHALMGQDLMFFSLLGIMALSGVAVNASLIMVDFYNRENTRLDNSYEALISAGLSRFRPLILTSATTVVGLMPLLINQSLSTLMFTPIAISLAFGIISSSAMALLLIPCFCLALEDIKTQLQCLRESLREQLRKN